MFRIDSAAQVFPVLDSWAGLQVVAHHFWADLYSHERHLLHDQAVIGIGGDIRVIKT